jgi:vacuolar-type H+-ATPase subunit F/Vma7
MKVRVLCRPEYAAGFELAGLMVIRVATDSAAPVIIRRLAADSDVGFILLDDELYASLPADVIARFDREAVPILVPVPAPRWDLRSSAESYVMDILRRAVGYRVRPR